MRPVLCVNLVSAVWFRLYSAGPFCAAVAAVVVVLVYRPFQGVLFDSYFLFFRLPQEALMKSPLEKSVMKSTYPLTHPLTHPGFFTSLNPTVSYPIQYPPANAFGTLFIAVRIVLIGDRNPGVCDGGLGS